VKIVRKIFELRVNGYSLGAIANWLYENKVPSPTGKAHWSRESISKLQRNQKYIGYIVNFDDFFLEQGENSKRNNIDEDTNKRKLPCTTLRVY